jgi:hypothetical protein
MFNLTGEIAVSKASGDEKRPVISGTILILLGIMMLGSEYASFDMLWPALIILVGVMMIGRYAFSNKKPTDAHQNHSSTTPPPPPPSAGNR